MTVLPELERQLVRAAGAPRVSPAPRRQFRGWATLAAGCLAAGIVVLVFAAVGTRHRRPIPISHPPVAVDPTVAATYFQACRESSDCLTVPPGPVPTALRLPFAVPQLQPGQRCPTSTATRFTNSYIGGVSLGTIPVRPDIGNRVLADGRIVLGTTEAPGWFGIKTVWFSMPAYRGPWSVRAVRLSGSGRIQLGDEPATRPTLGGSARSSTGLVVPPGDTLNTGDGYRTDPRSTWISGPGCYAFQVDGLGFSELIVFQAVAPGTFSRRP